MDLIRYSGISPLSYITLIISLFFSKAKSCKDADLFVTIQSSLAALFLMTLANAYFTSDINSCGPSIFCILWDFLYHRWRFLRFTHSFFRVFLFLYFLSSSFDFMHPGAESVFCAVKSLILLCISPLSMALVLSYFCSHFVQQFLICLLLFDSISFLYFHIFCTISCYRQTR